MKQYFDKEQSLVKLLNEYKDQLDFKTKSLEEIGAYIKNKPFVLSIKVDGILSGLQYSDGKALFATREGRITEELPVLNEISKFLNDKQETILFGELYGVDVDGNELPLNETISITRKPKSIEDEQRIKFAVFDIYKYDGKLVEENDYWKRILLVQELFENGKLVHPVYAKQEDGSSSIQKLWEEEVLSKGHEGIVLHVEGDTIKIKPTKTVDALVIAVKPNYEKGFVSSLFLALMDKDGIFRSTSFVGTGLKEDERVEYLQWANENKALAPNHDELIWIDINKNPRIVEVDYERPIVKETESFEFANGEWKQLEEDRLSATLIKPRLIRLREDKKVNASDLRLTQISDLEKELTKKSFKINADLKSYDDWFISEYNELPKYEYVYMHRMDKDGPLMIAFNDTKLHSTRIDGFNFDINKYKDRITNLDSLQNDINKVSEIGYDKINILKPSGEVKLFTNKKSFNLQAYYPKHPNTIIFPKSEFVRYPLTEASVWHFYDKVKDKIIQQTRGKNVLLYLRVNGDILKRKHDGVVRIDNYNDFNRLNSGRLVEIHVESCQEKRDTCLTDVIFCDIDPKENFGWKETKEVAKKVYSIFNKDSNVKKVTMKYSGGRGFHIFGHLRESWEIDRAREYTKRLLKPLENDKIKLGIVREQDMLRLDTTLLKRRGSLRAAYSLNKTTGLVAVPVDIKALDSFEKKDATIKKVLDKLSVSKKSFKLNSDYTTYSGEVISGLWGIWQDDVEAITSKGLHHEAWFKTIGFPDKGTSLGRSLFDKATRGRFMIIDGIMQVRIYKNAGNPGEALDKFDRLLNKIGHRDKYKKVEFYVEDESSSSRVATKFIISRTASILDYPKPGLEPKVWNFDGTINSDIKSQILEKLNKFIESQGYSAKEIINKIYVVGSLTSYQYNKLTDLDIHIYLNLQNMLGIFQGNEEDLMNLIDKNWRKILNKDESETIVGTQHPLEFYFEIPEDLKVAPLDGIYDLLNDTWIKEPKIITVDFDVEKIYPEIINRAKDIAKELDIQIGELKRDITDAEMIQEMVDYLSEEQKGLFVDKLNKKIEEIDNSIVDLLKTEQNISDKRHEDYAWDSEGNITFKYLQRFGYVSILKLLEKAIGADKKFDVDDIETTQKVLNPIKSFKLNAYKLYLDDERFPKSEGWNIVRTLDEFKSIIQEKGLPIEISFDHDLGLIETGYMAAKWLIDNEYDLRNIVINVHSANPIGRDNIYGIINSWNNFLDREKKSFKLVSFKFDPNVSEDSREQRWRLVDPQAFDKNSFRRWSKWAGVNAPEGITFLVGDLKKEKKKALQAIRFDTNTVSEKEAEKFWNSVKNKEGFEKTWTQKDWAKWVKENK